MNTETRLPRGFVATAALILLLELVMSAVPTLIYISMARSIRADTLLNSIFERSLPILLPGAVAWVAAVLINPMRHPGLATNLLGISLPISSIALVYGLR